MSDEGTIAEPAERVNTGLPVGGCPRGGAGHILPRRMSFPSAYATMVASTLRTHKEGFSNDSNIEKEKTVKAKSTSGGPLDLFWGQSRKSYDAAVEAAVEAARKALTGRTLEWFEVIEFRGGFTDGKIQYQVAVRIGYA